MQKRPDYKGSDFNELLMQFQGFFDRLRSKTWTQTDVAIIAAIIFLPLLFFAASRFGESSNITIEKVYSRYFDTPITSVSELDGKTSWTTNFEAYCRFKYSDKVQLKHASEFHSRWAEDARRWFAERWPDDRALWDRDANLTFLYRVDNSPEAIRNEWLLHNKRTNDYYFRVWGTTY